MFRNAFFINENQQQYFNIYITAYYIYHQDFSFFWKYSKIHLISIDIFIIILLYF